MASLSSDSTSTKEEHPLQKRLDASFLGLDPSKLPGVLLVCSKVFRAPPGFETVWHHCSAAPLDQLPGASAVLFALDVLDKQQFAELLSAIRLVDMVEDAPPMLVLPLVLEKSQLFCTEARAQLSRALQDGADSILAGAPEGHSLALQVHTSLPRVQVQAMKVSFLVNVRRAAVGQAEEVKHSTRFILWEYLNNRLFAAIPPLDRSLLVSDRVAVGYALGRRIGGSGRSIVCEAVLESSGNTEGAGFTDVPEAADSLSEESEEDSDSGSSLSSGHTEEDDTVSVTAGSAGSADDWRLPQAPAAAAANESGSTTTTTPAPRGTATMVSSSGAMGSSTQRVRRRTLPAQVMRVLAKSDTTTFEDMKDLNRAIEVHTLVSSVTWAHPNIAGLIGVFHAEHHLCFLMEHGGRLTLQQLLSPIGSTVDASVDLARVAKQVVATVAHLHAGPHVVHGDIRPANFRVRPMDEEPALKLVDWDHACVQEVGMLCRRKAGTMPYMAPEVVFTDEYCGFAADSWSLGITLLELLCGNGIMTKLLGIEADMPLPTRRKAGISELIPLAMKIQRLFRQSDSAQKYLDDHMLVPTWRAPFTVLAPQTKGLLELGYRRRLSAPMVDQALPER